MNKQAITSIVQKELPDNHIDKNIPIEKLLFKWWVTGRTGRGYRLTDIGYQAFIDAKIWSYSYTLNLKTLSEKLNNIKAKDLTLLLGKKISCPWYIQNTSAKNTCQVFVYDSKIAMMINLYGTLEEYLNRK